MYKNYFGLTSNPFEISPDPRFLFLTSSHREALATLFWSVKMRKGFTALTGEVGTGKTLIIHCLFNMLRQSNVSFAHVFNSRLSFLDLLRYVVADLGLTAGTKTKGELLWDLNNFLLARYKDNTTVALVIDEAQLLDWDLLEEIRLLTNLETAQHKLLQIVLVGQPELDRKLDDDNLRQLKQRITFRYRLDPLSRSDCSDYVSWRLYTAGKRKGAPPLFAADVLDRIWQLSGGIPRVINTLCENALIAAYAKRINAITLDVLDEVRQDLHLQVQQPVRVSGEVIPRETVVSIAG